MAHIAIHEIEGDIAKHILKKDLVTCNAGNKIDVLTEKDIWLHDIQDLGDGYFLIHDSMVIGEHQIQRILSTERGYRIELAGMRIYLSKLGTNWAVVARG